MNAHISGDHHLPKCRATSSQKSWRHLPIIWRNGKILGYPWVDNGAERKVGKNERGRKDLLRDLASVYAQVGGGSAEAPRARSRAIQSRKHDPKLTLRLTDEAANDRRFTCKSSFLC